MEPLSSTSGSTRPVLEHLCSNEMCARKGTYSVVGRCFNCRTEYELVLTRGHQKPGVYSGVECETCGCRKVTGHELIGGEDV